MQLYNSLTAAKQEFVIPTNRPVKLYVCGVTPYETTHIGHARTFIVFDVLIRYLRWRGAEVQYCQNVTDVDDPLFERARRDGVSWQDLTEDQVAWLLHDYATLNIEPPTYFPRASEEISAMIPMIERLIDLGHAYVRDGNVYFSVRTDPEFGTLARMGYDEMLATANQRGNKPDDSRKEDPLDFVLWQTGNPGDPTWDSPWGSGRPGWHIECSAMSTRYLGSRIDIHGGGRDLLFPHHSCEIAQTEPVTGQRPFVDVWMHAGLVWFDGEKMSKSLGNLVFVRDAATKYGPDALRWQLLSRPYREEFDYQHEETDRAKSTVERLRQALRTTGGAGDALDRADARDAFRAALDDDLDTPLALTILAGLANEILAAASEGRDVAQAQHVLAELVGVLGLRVADEKLA